MSYTPKLDWIDYDPLDPNNPDAIPKASDFNRIEEGIEDAHHKLTNHLNAEMPHKFIDGSTTYRWGFRTVNGVPQFIYEEVV